MVNRLIVDITPNGAVSVSVKWAHEAESTQIGEPTTVEWPLDSPILEELRWYLEDYLRAPFGVYADKGPVVAERMVEWGTALFEAVFAPRFWREAYGALRAQSNQAEIVIQSTSALHLGLPWELLHDPTRNRPLVLDGVGVVRCLPTNPLEPAFPLNQQDLRVLMVISRPAGDRDVGYRLIARPLLERLEAVRGKVDLIILRPPTLDRLHEVLSEAVREGKPFQIVHFDGHGSFGPNPPTVHEWNPHLFQDNVPQGTLSFEKNGGGTDWVPANKVAHVLAEGRVPVVVLNACQSGQLEAVAEAAIATRLVQDRVASVIAMAYSVYTHAAAEFITAFYERLFAGDRVADAVTAGRQRLAIADTRPSPKGPLPLKDWVVPVHYRRSDITLPGLRIDRTGQPPFQEILDRHRTPSSSTPDQGHGAMAPNSVFVGRDRLFHALETSLPYQKVVVLHGPAGIGKSELAKAFGRWWRDTQGVDTPTLVFWHSFEPGAHSSLSLNGVISQIGLQAFGAEFAALSPEQQQNAVQELLTARQSLLVWDNFETTHTLPDPTSATPPLNETERDKITAFLRYITHSRSALVITSRTPEDWLSQVRRIEVDRLTRQEADEYADHLLAPYPNTLPKRRGEAFAELLQWLDGHPMSMKLILPLLDETDPDTLLDGLRGITPLPGRDDADRDTSLAASITYSFTHLDPCDQQALTALSLFHNTADTNVLGMLSEISGVPSQFRDLTRDDWDRILNRATKIGLLTGMGDGIDRLYWIHPTLPSYLAELWSISHPDNFPAQHASTIRAILDVFASLSAWLYQQIQNGNTPLSVMVIERHQANLGSLLGYAIEHNQWGQAQAIIQPLSKYWKLRGLNEEARAWIERIRNILESPDGTPPTLNSDAGDLWLFSISAEAVLQVDALKLEEAEQTYCSTLEGLKQLNHSSPQQELNISIIYYQLGLISYRRGEYEKAKRLHNESLAIGEQFNHKSGKAGNYHQLGVISYAQGAYESAEEWYRESLAIHLEEGDLTAASSLFHELGIVCRKQGRLKEAEGWYIKSLNTSQEINDRPRQASTYHQLSILACERRELTSAEKWCHKSISLYEKLDDRPEKAYAYHQLGIINSLKGAYRAAEEWYNKSLEVKRKIGDHPGLASGYHQLGIAAQRQGYYNKAEKFYKKSLAIFKQLDSRPGKAVCYGQLGLLSEERGNPEQGLAWIVKSVCLFDAFPHPATGPAPFHLKRLSRQLGLPILERVWQEVTGQGLPAAVRHFSQNSDDTI